MNKQTAITAIIQEMRAQSAAQAADRDADYFKALASPKFAAAEKQLRELIIKIGKTSAEGRSTAALEKELAKQTVERDKLFAPHRTAPKIQICPKCGNTGYIKNKLCPCVLKQYTQKLSAESGLPETASKSFSSIPTSVFKDNKIKDEMKKIYAKLAQFCEKFPDVKTPSIVLSGATGTGKTYAAQTLGSVLLSRGFSVLYTTSFALIQRFKDYIFNFEKTDGLSPFMDCDLLIIDDLGTEPTIKNITQEYLYNVINERLNSKKSFLITTNLTPSQLAERYDQRLASRILSAQTTALIELKGTDLRLQ